MFRGNHPTRVDEKGRLKLPADLKSELEGGGEGKQVFYITSRDGKRAEIYPMKLWEQIEQDLAKQAASAGKRKLLNFTSFYGRKVEMDVQGRVLIPQPLRDDANLNGEDVAVMGQLTYIAVANEKQYRAQLLEEPATDEDIESLNIVGL